MKSNLAWLAVLTIAVSALPAQELIRLKGGTAMEGKVTGRGKRLTVRSAFGVAKVAAADVVSRTDPTELRAQYEQQLSAVPDGFISGRCALARWCIDRGLLSAARTELEAVFRKDIDHQEGRGLASQLAATWCVHSDENGTKGRERRRYVRALFKKVAPRSRLDAVMALEKALVRDPDETLRPALDGLKHLDPGVRWMSARLLARNRKSPERIKPLYRRALLDPSFAVRREAVRSLGVTEDPVFARLFARNLFNDVQRVRMNAAEALGELGMQAGVKPLVGVLKASAGGGVRNHIAVTTQRAYVKDFDVEIAQAAVIADPVVDVVTDGVVLDVTLVGVSIERAAYGAALERLTGASLGTDVRAWESLLEQQGK